MLITSLDDIQIVRTGFGSYHLSARQALQQGKISVKHLENILNTITQRNEAAIALGL